MAAVLCMCNIIIIYYVCAIKLYWFPVILSIVSGATCTQEMLTLSGTPDLPRFGRS